MISFSKFMDQTNLETAKLTILEAQTHYANLLENYLDAHYSDCVSLESRVEMVSELMDENEQPSRTDILENIVKNHC